MLLSLYVDLVSGIHSSASTLQGMNSRTPGRDRRSIVTGETEDGVMMGWNFKAEQHGTAQSSMEQCRAAWSNREKQGAAQSGNMPSSRGGAGQLRWGFKKPVLTQRGEPCGSGCESSV